MNSIEYLFNELWEVPKDKLTWHSILEKTKLLHKQEISDNSPKEENKTSFGEISDEEIEKAAREYTFNEYQKVIDYENYDTYNDWINGAKWYREQLKTKK
jgi:hypothetical protein